MTYLEHTVCMNSIALRMAKLHRVFGHSECIRVKKIKQHVLLVSKRKVLNCTLVCCSRFIKLKNRTCLVFSVFITFNQACARKMCDVWFILKIFQYRDFLNDLINIIVFGFTLQ